MQNATFRYTRYINARKKRIGHLFQGRYKAILIDADTYLLELVRYIHNNPVRAKISKTADQYLFSSHQAYLDRDNLPWLTTDFVLSQFAKQYKRALHLYHDFVLKCSTEEHRQEFYIGFYDGRILGDDRFSEKVLAKTTEKYSRNMTLEDVVKVVCTFYNISFNMLAGPGKARPASEARAVAAALVQEFDNLTTLRHWGSI